MLCDHCHEAEATVHLTQVVDGSVKKLHLCETCAAKSGFDLQGPISITDILLGLGGAMGAAPEVEEKACPRCHLRRTDFKKTGRLGCPDCYDAFAGELVPLIKAMHRKDQHAGKVPSREGARTRLNAEVAALQKRLDQAVEGEDYEEAARLRDELQRCRQRAASGDEGAGRS